jgi:hypothetical protein
VKTPNVHNEAVPVVHATPELWSSLVSGSTATTGLAGARMLLVFAPATKMEIGGHAARGRKQTVKDIIRTNGRFKYRDGFEDIWIGNEHFDLRTRPKARLCIRFLVEHQAFDTATARHFRDEIDPFVRKAGDYLPSVEIKIDHYFNDQTGRLPKLRKDLIRAAGRNGKFYLKTD